MTPDYSVVIPVFNEEESLPALFTSLEQALPDRRHEIILVDDGSSDATWRLLQEQTARDDRLRAARLARNFGQTAALAAGFDMARGNVVLCLDADGQHDPADIPRLLEEIDRGADVVSGWRSPRNDAWLTRRLPSGLANFLIALVTRVPLHDFGCTLKAYRRDVIKGLRLYGEMHRFLPAWCAWKGARLVEVKVRHYPRVSGKSKYGLGRTFKVLLDLITAKFFTSYLSKPSYFFGGAGLVLLLCGFLAGLFPIMDKFVFDLWGHLRIPFMIFSVFLGLLGAQFIVFGLLAEILIRIYFESKNDRPYQMAEEAPSSPASSTAV